MPSFRRLHALLIAVVALALSAGLAFAGQPTGGAPASSHANTSTQAGDEQEVEETNDEDAAEDTDTDEATESENESESADNCTTDPTPLTDEQRAAMTHGQIVCWAAHQTEWPEQFKNHGAFVSSWAHWGKGGNEASTNAKTKGKGKGHAGS